MVFASLHPARYTYRLWHRFRMPTASGSKDAVAVPETTGDQLLSTYTFLLGHIVLLCWWIAIIIALYITVERHPGSKLYASIWKKRSSPYRIVQFAFKRFLWPQTDQELESSTSSKPQPIPDSNIESSPDHELQSDEAPKHNRWFLLLWLFIGISFVIVKYLVPIYFARFIRIGDAAPVSPDVIYLPSAEGTTPTPHTTESNIKSLQYEQLFVPAALRAAGSIDSANDTFKSEKKELPVTINTPEILGSDANGEIQSIGYSYIINSLDLGLQNYSDLVLYVEGSCRTEYSWWTGSTTNYSSLPGVLVDQYTIFSKNYSVSKYDSGPPSAKFLSGPYVGAEKTNRTWAALISSVNRTSFSNSTDPWYQTGPNPAFAATQNPDLGPYIVLPGRPALSCWENDVWSFHGKNVSINVISNNSSFSVGIQEILGIFTKLPAIVFLGSHLGQSALTSSFTSTGYVFDASQASIFADLQRLILASYILSVNSLTESTLFNPPATILDLTKNYTLSAEGVLYPGTSDFVIFSSDVAALSIKALIIIPTITLGLWIILLLILYLPNIKRMINRLKDKVDPKAPAVANLKKGAEETKEGMTDDAENTSCWGLCGNSE